MSLIDYRLGETINKVEVAIQRLRAFEPEDGYFLAFSGGKDSVCIKALADMAGVKYDAHYSVTSVDPPELVQFIKTFLDVSRDIPRYKDGGAITMWNLIPRNGMPPTRIVRYCCAELKETAGVGRVGVTGVRWAESVNRKANRNVVDIGGKGNAIVYNDDNDEARRTVEQCYRTKKTLVNPVIDWLNEDVWEFIHSNNIAYCGLYDDGFDRLGCIGCPMSTHAAAELARWPKYYDAYIRAFDRMLAERERKGKETTLWHSGEEVMDWWLNKQRDKPLEGQFGMELDV